MHIHHKMCGHGGERRIAGYPVDGFCWETNAVFQFHGCHWHDCSVRVFSRTAQGSGRFRKNKARQERADTRDVVCKNVG